METSLGAQIRKYRRDCGLTQEAVSEAVGVTPEYISRIENDKDPPSWRILLKLAGVFHVTPEQLLAAAGLIEQPALDREEVARMIAAYPRLADAFEYARRTGDRKLLAHLERQAHLLLLEKEREDNGDEPGESTDRENSPAGD